MRADASQFETALVNMAVNARDAMDGRGHAHAARHDGSAPAGHPRPRRQRRGLRGRVAVRHGRGHRARAPGAVFEPFFTTKEVGKGTGLGLSQVFGFAKQSGGDIDVESEPGRGTTFTLYLPQVATAAGREPSRTAHGACACGGGRRVLVVEDNVEVGRFATQMLDDLGYQTDWAANADEALAQLATAAELRRRVLGRGDAGHERRRPGPGDPRRYPDLPVVLTSRLQPRAGRGGRRTASTCCTSPTRRRSSRRPCAGRPRDGRRSRLRLWRPRAVVDLDGFFDPFG